MGLRKVNTKGLAQANKVMLLSATAYNLKKHLKFISNDAQSKVEAIFTPLEDILSRIAFILAHKAHQI